MNSNNIGKRIKSIRLKENMSQKEFAQIMKVSIPYLESIEKDIENPSKIFIQLFCSTFGINSEWILYGIGKTFMRNQVSDLQDVLIKKYEAERKMRDQVSDLQAVLIKKYETERKMRIDRANSQPSEDR